MTKRNFEAIAAILREQYETVKARFFANYMCDPEHLQVRKTAETLADYFQAENPRFDRALFLKACGMDD